MESQNTRKKFVHFNFRRGGKEVFIPMECPVLPLDDQENIQPIENSLVLII
jgi:hypothetical protein